MNQKAKKERASPTLEPEEAEQIRRWAAANGYGKRHFNDQVRMAALYASRDFAAEPETADAR